MLWYANWRCIIYFRIIGYDVKIISGFNGKVIKQELDENDQVKTILLSVN